MAVPKTTETRCRDRAYKHCTNNPIPTSFFLQVTSFFDYVLRLRGTTLCMKKRCRDGVIFAVFVCPVSTSSFCSFWHCHPYLNIFGKCFIYLSTKGCSYVNFLLPRAFWWQQDTPQVCKWWVPLLHRM